MTALPGEESLSPWPSRMAWVVAACTFVMICAGAMVTTMAAGDAVPDWPLSYGSVFPREEWKGGVVYEHGHRMIGWLLGLLTLLLVVSTFVTGASKGVKRTVLLGLLALLVQGGLGGLRVLVESDRGIEDDIMRLARDVFGSDTTPRQVGATFAILHASLAQLVLCLFVALGLSTSPAWRRTGGRIATPHAGKLRRLGVLTVVFLFIQLVLGALARHLDVEKTLWTHIHLGWALIAVVHVVLVARRAMKVEPTPDALRRSAALLGFLVITQVVLGFVAYVAKLKAKGSWNPAVDAIDFVRTGHVAIGALLLVGALALTLHAFRWTARPEAAA